jgi:uncharacterized membrane protein
MAAMGVLYRRRVHRLATVAILTLAASSATLNAAQPTFMGLGDLPSGDVNSVASGVSADGSVVVGTSGSEAFRWSSSMGMVGLGGNSTAADVSADGSVIVGTWGSQAFRWTHSDGLVGLGDFPAGDFRSFGHAVSDDGLVVVGRGTSVICSPGSGRCGSILRGFRWTEDSGMQISSISTPTDVSGDGSVIVGGGARWTLDGGIDILGDLTGGSLNSFAWGVSADGSIVVGQGNPGAEAFRWTESSGMVGLGILPGFNASLAQAVSADGSLVVGYSGDDSLTSGQAFLWNEAHGMRSLRDVLVNDHGLGASLAGWTLTSANDISADGRFIVGSGINPSGNTEAWLAELASQSTFSGDFNHDGAVNAADYVVWRNGFAIGAYMQDDYNIWRANFGATAAGAAAVAQSPLQSPVPEPTALALAALAIALLAVRRK